MIEHQKKQRLTTTIAMVFAIVVVIISIPQSGCDEGMQMAKPMLESSAEVIEVSYYLDEDFTKPLVHNDKVMVRETIYTKVVFSKAVPGVIADDASARPRIYHADREKRPDSDFNSIKIQYHIKPRGANLQSGDAKPYRDSDHIFICKFMPQRKNIGYFFFTFVNNKKFSDVKLWFTYSVDREVPPVNVETITDWNPEDFTGVVYEPGFNYVGVPAGGVTVTIMSGARTGESTITDNNGRYLFSDVDKDDLHLRAERKYLEPKEVIVHRSRDTFLPNGTISSPFYHVQRNPGGIMLGHPWPDEIRFILEEMLVVPDLLLIQYDLTYFNGIPGFYSGSERVCAIANSSHDSVIAHELVHAHQHALVIMHGSENLADWENTPEGKAYVVAREKDLEEFGKIPVDSEFGYDGDVLYENAARVCVFYWSIDRWRHGYTLEHTKRFNEEIIPNIPNRLKWAEEWLNKKY